MKIIDHLSASNYCCHTVINMVNDHERINCPSFQGEFDNVPGPCRSGGLHALTALGDHYPSEAWA